MLSIKGVLIDFGYTIAYVDEEEDNNYRKKIVTILKKNGYGGTLDEFSLILENAYRSNRAGETKNMYEFWSSLLNNLDISKSTQLIQELEETRRQYVGKTIRLYDGVPFVLSDLSKKYRLALVSNCSTGLSEVIEALGLNRFFEYIVLSYMVGVKKPDTGIYLKALRGLKLRPEECVFLADEISDLEGAKRVGLNTILVRQGPHTTRNVKDLIFKPDHQCDNIREILKFL